MRRADRLIKIVHYLRRMRQAVTARQIADHFEICQRTVYRDIQDLMNSGVPIYGEAGVGYIIDKNYHLPPVMFDFDELDAIALGINMVRSWTDDQFSAVAERAPQTDHFTPTGPFLQFLERTFGQHLAVVHHADAIA